MRRPGSWGTNPGSGVICETRALPGAVIPAKLVPAQAGGGNLLRKALGMPSRRAGFPLARE